MKKFLCGLLTAALMLGSFVPTAFAEGTSGQDPFSVISMSDIYGDPSRFAVVRDADNGNHPQIDSGAGTLGWLGAGACVSVKNLDFGTEALVNKELSVELTRSTETIDAATHFEVYALPAGTTVDGNLSQLTDKIGELPAIAPTGQLMTKSVPVADNKLQGQMDLYFKFNSGGFNLKSIRFADRPEPIEVDKDNALIYTSEASRFGEALPLGNGFIGAMVYGGVEKERIGLNETTIWTGSPYENDVEDAYTKLPELKEKALTGASDGGSAWTNQFVDTGKTDPDNYALHAYGVDLTGTQRYQMAGELNLTMDHDTDSYVRYLDLDTATAVTQYRWNDSLITREYFVSNADRVMVMHLSSDNKPVTFTGTYDLKDMLSRDTGITVEGDDTILIKGKPDDYRGVESKIEFTVRVKFLPEDGDLEKTENGITVKDTTDCTILTTIATNFVSYKDISGDEDKLASEMMNKACAKPYEKLRQAHIEDYQKLFNRVSLELGGGERNVPVAELRQKLADSDDPSFIELAYNFDRYLQIAGSREGAQPTNLQGIWNDLRRPMWDSNYTTNINLQMNYWATLPTNLEECYEPVIEKLKSFQDKGHRTAEEHYGITTEGAWTLHHNSDIWSVTAPVAGDGGITPTCGAWLTNEAYNVYLYNQNRAYLEELYPIMKGAAQFLLEFMTEDENGQYVICPSTSPEINNLATNQRVSKNSAYDIQVTTELFKNVIAASEILGQDPEFAETVEAAMEKLPPVVGVGSWGQVKEFYDYDADQTNNTHRHISHLYGVFPGTTITEDNKEYWDAAYKTLVSRSQTSGGTETLTGWSIAWRIIQFAYFGDEAKAYEFVKTMYDMSYQYSEPNLFTLCPPFQYDANGGMLQAVTSMLAVDQNGAELLKGLPEQWGTGSVKGLRLKGNFVLDELTWKDGKLVSATVTSNSGQPLDLRYGDKRVTMDTVAGQTYVFDKNLERELPSPVDKTELNKVIEQAEAVLESGTLAHDYEKEAADSLKSAYDAAVEVKNRESAAQEEVDAVAGQLSDAVDALEKSKKDWTKLDSLLADGQKILDEIKEGKYTEKTAAVYKNAYESAAGLEDEATQSQINEASAALEKAEKELKLHEQISGEDNGSAEGNTSGENDSSHNKPDSGTVPETDNSVGKNTHSASPGTGDSADPVFWIGLLAACGITVAVIQRKMRDYRRKR